MKERTLIKAGEERDWWLIKEWTTKAGLRAQINQCEWKLTKLLPDHFTGYVLVPEDDKTDYYTKYDLLDVHGGVTFYGDLNNDGKTWVGFDTAHYGDDNVKLSYVVRECEKLAEQLVARHANI